MMERTLHRDFYFSDEIFQRETESIFFREWFCVGREEDWPNSGDYHALDVLGESVLVVRTREGRLTAHYNVCRHRGSRLVPEGARGSFTGAIRCPYHSWTYALDGSLRAAPFLDEESGFSRADLGLYPVGLESWGGFVFLNLTPVEASGRANGFVNVGGFSASLLTMALVGVVLDLRAAGTAYDLGDFRVAMSVQYFFWALGAVQMLRYRRKAVAHLRREHPGAVESMKRGEPFVHPGFADREGV